MNPQQRKAAEGLQLALARCHRAGLSGGIYEQQFCVWPSEDDIRATGTGFFEKADAVGLVLKTRMDLDGGAGW